MDSCFLKKIIDKVKELRTDFILATPENITFIYDNKKSRYYSLYCDNNGNSSMCQFGINPFSRNVGFYGENDIDDCDIYCDYVKMSKSIVWQIQFNSELVDKEKLFKVLEILIIKTDDEIDINELSSLMKPLFKDCNFEKKEYFKK